ncbi:MAG: VIT1/CCC1 transporter family protein [Nitrososphaeria archaeon]|nr:VIT1/CCC1 transporter family protein [Nitrososphaeria archaeon]
MNTSYKVRFRNFWEDEIISSIIYADIAKKVKAQSSFFNNLSAMEHSHAKLWATLSKNLYGVELKPSLALKLKLYFMKFLISIIGFKLTLKMFELNEMKAVREYYQLFTDPNLVEYKGEFLILLKDEMFHEIEFLKQTIGYKREIEGLKDALYGLLDALVEIEAAVIGIASFLPNPILIGLAGLISAISGTFSMSTGAYVSSKSEKVIYNSKVEEVDIRSSIDKDNIVNDILDDIKSLTSDETILERLSQILRSEEGLVKKLYIISKIGSPEIALEDPKLAAKNAAIYYFIGALAPIVPFFLGLSGFYAILLSITLTIVILTLASTFVAVVSGTSIKRKAIETIAITLLATLSTYIIGTIAKSLLGIEI